VSLRTTRRLAWLVVRGEGNSAGGCRRGKVAGSVSPGHSGAPYQRGRIYRNASRGPVGGCALVRFPPARSGVSGSRERSGAFDLAARVGERGRGL